MEHVTQQMRGNLWNVMVGSEAERISEDGVFCLSESNPTSTQKKKPQAKQAEVPRDDQATTNSTNQRNEAFGSKLTEQVLGWHLEPKTTAAVSTFTTLAFLYLTS